MSGRPTAGNQVCPHCGGRNGYYTTQRRTVDRLYAWEQVTSESGARCQDCDKPLTKAAITKAAGSTQ